MRNEVIEVWVTRPPGNPPSQLFGARPRGETHLLSVFQLSSLSLSKQFAVPLMDHNGPLLCLDKEMKTKEEYLFYMRIVAQRLDIYEDT